LTACLAFSAFAVADDSTATLGMGGIVFAKNTPVRMKAEDLYVSPKSVRVRFEFVNDTSKDVDTIVAFPLPDIDNEEHYFSALGTTTDDPQNFVGFSVKVDGKPVAFKVEQRAFIKDRDVTGLLAAAGLPVNVVIGKGLKKFDALADAKRKQLIAAGVLAGDTPSPLWTVRTKFYWSQRFAARKTVVIEHAYQPVTGMSPFSSADADPKHLVSDQDYCIDPQTWRRIEALSVLSRKTNPDNNGYFNVSETAYILKTANNWNGPIGRFHLTLDKLKPENGLSLCWGTDLKKTGPTTFETTLINFAPTRDIKLVVFEAPSVTAK
jgi:hypothetical protein